VSGGGNAGKTNCYLEFKKYIGYAVSMRRDIVCKKSAFKHKITLENIRHALDYPWYEGALDGYENKYIVLGTDRAGNLLEIMYNEMEDGTLNVFHAQLCRAIYLPLLKN